MNREVLKGCGCGVAVLAVVAVIGTAGTLAVTAAIGFMGWPAALALAAVLAAGVGTIVYLAARFIAEALERARRARPLAPYRVKLGEIDRLLRDVEARYAQVPGVEFDGAIVVGKIEQLRTRKDEVVRALLEADSFLGAPGNEERRLTIESAFIRLRSRVGPVAMRPEHARNASRLREVAGAVTKVKSNRRALIANLERIAIGLRGLRAQLFLPDTSPAAVAREIDQEIEAVAHGLDLAEKARREIEEMELEFGEGKPKRERPKLTQ